MQFFGHQNDAITSFPRYFPSSLHNFYHNLKLLINFGLLELKFCFLYNYIQVYKGENYFPRKKSELFQSPLIFISNYSIFFYFPELNPPTSSCSMLHIFLIQI